MGGGDIPGVLEIVPFVYNSTNGATFEFKEIPDAFVTFRNHDLSTAQGWIDFQKTLNDYTGKNARYVWGGVICENLASVEIGGVAAPSNGNNYVGEITRTGEKTFSVSNYSVGNSNGITFSVIALKK